MYHGVMGKRSKISYIKKQDNYSGCGQLETIEHVLKECPLYPTEQQYLRKVAPELDPRISLDTKKNLVTIIEFLDLLSELHG